MHCALFVLQDLEGVEEFIRENQENLVAIGEVRWSFHKLYWQEETETFDLKVGGLRRS